MQFSVKIILPCLFVLCTKLLYLYYLTEKNIVDPWEEEISAVECLHKPAIKLNLLLPL